MFQSVFAESISGNMRLIFLCPLLTTVNSKILQYAKKSLDNGFPANRINIKWDWKLQKQVQAQ